MLKEKTQQLDKVHDSFLFCRESGGILTICKEFLKNIMAFCQVWGEHIFEVKKVRFVLLFEMA